MKVVAYCAQTWEVATTKVLDVVVGEKKLYTSPPLDYANINMKEMEDCSIIVFNLHGMPRVPTWSGEGPNGMTLAIRDYMFDGLDLSKVIVIAENCFGEDPNTPEEDSPMTTAIMKAEAKAIVGGAGLNYGGSYTPMGSDIIAKHTIKGLQRGWTVSRSLMVAKFWMLLDFSQAGKDAKRFTIVGDSNAKMVRG